MINNRPNTNDSVIFSVNTSIFENKKNKQLERLVSEPAKPIKEINVSSNKAESKKPKDKLRKLHENVFDQKLYTVTSKFSTVNNIMENHSKINTSNEFYSSVNKNCKDSFSNRHGLYNEFNITGHNENKRRFTELVLREKNNSSNKKILFNNIVGVSFTKYYAIDK